MAVSNSFTPPSPPVNQPMRTQNSVPRDKLSMCVLQSTGDTRVLAVEKLYLDAPIEIELKINVS